MFFVCICFCIIHFQFSKFVSIVYFRIRSWIWVAFLWILLDFVCLVFFLLSGFLLMDSFMVALCQTIYNGYDKVNDHRYNKIFK